MISYVQNRHHDNGLCQLNFHPILSQLLPILTLLFFLLSNLPRLLLEVALLQVPRHARQPDHQPVQLLRHLHLATQPACLRQPEGQVEHVVLVVRGLRHALVVVEVLHDHVAGAAGARAAARALHLELVVLRDVEEVGAGGDLVVVRDAGLVDDGEVESGAGKRSVGARVVKNVRGGLVMGRKAR